MTFGGAVHRAAHWVLPAGLWRLVHEAHRRYRAGLAERDPVLRSSFASNAFFRMRHPGERCFILATGPSVRDQDLTVLSGELCIAVSHFFLHPYLDVIRPRYHVVAPYHPPFGRAAVKKLLRGLRERYGKHKVDFFLGYTPYEHSIYNVMRAQPEYVLPNVHYVNYTASAQLSSANALCARIWDIAGNPFAPRTVLYSAIQLAVYLGAKEIYLIGCDHDYLRDIKRVTDHHFYAEEEGVSDAEHLQPFTLEKWFREYSLRWKQYRLMRDYVQRRGAAMYDATKGGMLDVFPKVSLSEIVPGQEVGRQSAI